MHFGVGAIKMFRVEQERSQSLAINKGKEPTFRHIHLALGEETVFKSLLIGFSLI